MPSGPGARLMLVQHDTGLLSLELGLNVPPRTSHVGQGLQGSVLGRIGQVIAGFVAAQILAVHRPQHLPGLPVPGFPYPLGAEPVGSWPLRSPQPP